MSAYSFNLDVVDQQNGYTILCLPGDQNKRQEGSESAKSSAQENVRHQGQDYVLWEV